MTVPVTGTEAYSDAISPTQNTAPVLEFRCLYTADLRRKQKRWQDGRLKYHTFNKRVMVYDDRSNFVGDSHWREVHAFGEGAAVELERCGILVEVSECVGIMEQDLAPLLNKVAKKAEERAHIRGFASCPSRPPAPGIRTQPIGLSGSVRTDLSLAKRRKLNNFPSSKNGYAQNLTGAILALSGKSSNRVPLHNGPARSRIVKQPIEGIDLSDDAESNQIQEGSVTVSICQTQPRDGSQANRLSNTSLPGHSDSSDAQYITGAALILESTVMTDRRLPPTLGTMTNATTWSGKPQHLVTTMENSEFIDADGCDRSSRRADVITKPSSQIVDLAKSYQKKPLPEPSSHHSYSKEDQIERPFYPLRIRSQPRKKLLSTVSPISRRFPLTEANTENSNRQIRLQIAPKVQRKAQPLLAPVLKVVSLTESGSPDMEQAYLRLPDVARIDHHSTDMFLTRDIPLQTDVVEEKHAGGMDRTKSTTLTRSASEWGDHTDVKDQERVLCAPGLQLQVQQSDTGSPKRLLMPLVNGHTDNSKICASVSAKSRSFPQLTNSFSVGNQNTGPYGEKITNPAEDIINPNPTHKVGRNLTVRQGVVPLKPSAKLACPTTESLDLALSDNKQDELDVSQAATSTKPASLPSRTSIGEIAIANRNQGPWTREAFDLFDWRHGAHISGNNFVKS